MTKHVEIERRFITSSVKLQRGAIGRPIEQGYFQTPAHATVRLRRTGGDHGTYELTQKTGRGRTRVERTSSITDRTLGQALLSSCPYVLRKRRFVRDGWEIDRYIGPLKGLWVLERELSSADEPCILPPWVDASACHEVTDYLNNYDLAKLATVLRGQENPPSILDLLIQRLPIIVVTGGPCSGKTSTLDAIRREHGNRVHVIPEAASIIISNVGVQYPASNGVFVKQFQQQLYAVQQSFEFLARMHGKMVGAQAVVEDRGSADSIAYMPGGAVDFERACQTELAYEYGRYGMVICLAVPPQDVYEKFHASNPARRETYQEAVVTGERTRAAWAGHPNFHYVDASDWNAKVEHVRALIETFLG